MEKFGRIEIPLAFMAATIAAAACCHAYNNPSKEARFVQTSTVFAPLAVPENCKYSQEQVKKTLED